MTYQFTPGPWEVDIEDGIPGVFAEDAQPICYTGEVRGFVHDWQRDTAAGDAHLIAAAPKMLGILHNIILSSSNNCGDSLANAINEAKDIVANFLEIPQ